MNREKVSVVLVKLFAILIVVISLQNITTYFSWIGNEESSYILGMAFLFNALIPFVIAGLLWFFPATLIGLRDVDVSHSSSALEMQPNILSIGITLLALYALLFGIVDFLYYEARRVAEEAFLDVSGLSAYQVPPDIIAGRITNIVQIVLGTVLLVGRNGIATFLLKVRTAGVE